MSDVFEINDPEGLSPLHVAWSALHAATPGATYFQTLDWLRAWWTHYGNGKRLRVVIVSHRGQPIGILPLVEHTVASRLGGVRVLGYPLDDWGVAFGPIGPWSTATMTLALRHVAKAPRTWDTLDLGWTPTASTDRGRTERALRLAGFAPKAAPHRQWSTIECARFGGWDNYLASRTKKIRHELLRQRRQLERCGRVEHVVHRPEPQRAGGGDPRWDLFQACVAVSRKSWQAISTNGNTLCQPDVAPFLVDAHRGASRLGMAVTHLLKVNGQPAAYFYGYQNAGEVFGLRMGYDPAAPKGAGAVLFGRVIEHCLMAGDRKLVLGAGNEAFKERFRTTVEHCDRLTHTPPAAWRPRVIEAAHWARRRFGAVAEA